MSDSSDSTDNANLPLRTVRISKPADLLGIVPYRLGFHPSESLVVFCLEGRRRRDKLVMRVDLVEPRHDEELVDHVASRIEHAKTSDALVVVYTEADDDSHGLARARLVRWLRRRLRESGIGLLDALLVRDGRWWSYLCNDRTCCPTVGTPLPAEPTAAAISYAAETVAQGGAVLPDRAALVRSIEPSDDPTARELRVVAADVAGDLLMDALDSGGVAAVRALTRSRFADLRTSWRSGEGLVAEDVAVVAIGLRDKTVRDELMTAVLDDDADELVGLLEECVRQVDDEDAAPLCTVLAWVAHAGGHGALAATAAQRALRAEPDYEMARLVLEGMDRMLPPSALREVALAVREELGEDLRDERAS
jgi:hypothetical protein